MCGYPIFLSLHFSSLVIGEDRGSPHNTNDEGVRFPSSGPSSGAFAKPFRPIMAGMLSYCVGQT